MIETLVATIRPLVVPGVLVAVVIAGLVVFIRHYGENVPPDM